MVTLAERLSSFCNFRLNSNRIFLYLEIQAGLLSGEWTDANFTPVHSPLRNLGKGLILSFFSFLGFLSHLCGIFLRGFFSSCGLLGIGDFFRGLVHFGYSGFDFCASRRDDIPNSLDALAIDISRGFVVDECLNRTAINCCLLSTSETGDGSDGCGDSNYGWGS